jgi:hypothetical protein
MGGDSSIHFRNWERYIEDMLPAGMRRTRAGGLQLETFLGAVK